MNVPDLRNIDFDAYRQRAHGLREQAISEAFDRALSAVKALRLSWPQTALASTTRAPSVSAHCPA